jgi:hypothetical protein
VAEAVAGVLNVVGADKELDEIGGKGKGTSGEDEDGEDGLENGGATSEKGAEHCIDGG